MFKNGILAALWFLISSTIAVAQTAEPWQRPTVCEQQAVIVQVVSLKRVGPGGLMLTMQVQSTANIPLKFGSGFQLVDDAGDSWKAHAESLSNGQFHPGVKTTTSLTFRRDIGGNKGSTASLSSQILVGAVGQAKNFGSCALSVTGIPIQS
jgi:hypothetical protein